jgi:hypothetical protein
VLADLQDVVDGGARVRGQDARAAAADVVRERALLALARAVGLQPGRSPGRRWMPSRESLRRSHRPAGGLDAGVGAGAACGPRRSARGAGGRRRERGRGRLGNRRRVHRAARGAQRLRQLGRGAVAVRGLLRESAAQHGQPGLAAGARPRGRRVAAAPGAASAASTSRSRRGTARGR